MRNLKRALSLALASVMVMGLAVVGSNASYVDVTSKQNQEAIEVLQKVGIMVGDENGKFNPEAKVTRNEMAVIMANLMDYRVSTYKGTSPFTDVPAWAEPYVAACYTNGIISGYSAKTFGGNDPVSTSQAALMLMKALGYFQYQSDFEDDWQLATVKQGNKIELFEDVASNVKESMTRNDVAQLVLNALKSGMVEANDDTIKVTTGGTTVEAGKVQYEYVSSKKEYAKAIDNLTAVSSTSTSTNGWIVELGEKLYQGDLKLDDGASDDFEAPAHTWTYKNEEIGTYATEPDYTFAGIVKSNAMYSAVGKTVAKASNYTWSVYTDGAYEGKAKSDKMQSDVNDNKKSDLDLTARGTNTYVYLNDDDHTATVVVKSINIAEVTKVKDGTITLDTDIDGAKDFDITGYSEGDMVLFTYAKNDVQEILGKAEVKEGTIETVRDQDRIVIDGTTYKYAKNFNGTIDEKQLNTDFVDQKVSFYLDGQGNIIAFDDTTASRDYAYVYSVGATGDQYGGDRAYGAKLIMADGTLVNANLDSDTAKEGNGGTKPGVGDDGTVKAYWEHKVVSYSKDDNGQYSLTKRGNKSANYTSALSDVTKNGSARVLAADGTTALYADKNTVFLINDANDDADDFNAYVGYKNVPDTNRNGASTMVAYVGNDGVAKFVVLTHVDVEGSSNDVVFVVGNPNATVNKTGSTEYYVYDAVVNGEVTSIKVKADSKAQKDLLSKLNPDVKGQEIGVYFGLTKDSKGYVTGLTSKTPNDVAVNEVTNKAAGADKTNVAYSVWTGVKRESSGGNVTLGGSSMAANSKALIVYYDGEDLSVESRLVTDSNDKPIVVTNDGDIVAICVLDCDAHGLTHG